MNNETILAAIAKAASRYSCEIDTDALTITLSNGAVVEVRSAQPMVRTTLNGIDQRIDGWCYGDADANRLATSIEFAIDKAEKIVAYQGEAIRVRKQVSEDNSYDIDIDLDDAISKMQRDRTRYTRDGWTKLALEYTQGSYSDYDRLFLYGERFETSQETNKRLQSAKAAQENRDKRDREEWERLNKRFGPQS